MTPMKHLRAVILFLALLARAPAWSETPPPPVWNAESLIRAAHEPQFGAVDGQVQEVWYNGESFGGKPTRIFAYLGRPGGGSGKAPAVLLVHGGGGRAFKDWASRWASRGYVALAMDTAGQGPDGKRHEHAGPSQEDDSKFVPFEDGTIGEMWTFHAVAAVLRGHGLLASLPEVDPDRIAVTGISWGGYLTCIVAGVDPALKAAVPVYGCGFLGDASYWRDRSLAALTEVHRARWLKRFDPSVWLPGVRCPVLFVNGTKDFAYPADSHQRSSLLVDPSLCWRSVRVDMPHGHIWTFGEVDSFIDWALKSRPKPVKLGAASMDGAAVSSEVETGVAVRATLHVTADTGPWSKRRWRDVEARVDGSRATAVLPNDRPLTFFFTASDEMGLIASSPYSSLDTGPNSACQPVGKLEEDFYDWHARHEAVLALKESVKPEIVLIGDSITHLWGGQPLEPRGNRGAESWDSLFGGRAVMNLGFGWDRTQNVLWRIQHGELDGLRPRFAVIHIGTNNLAGTPNARENTPAEIAEGIQAVVERTKAVCPGVKILLIAVMPRGEKPDDPSRRRVAAINALLPEVAKTTGATLIDLTGALLEPDGTIARETMPDFLHPGPRGYAVWADALRPHLNP